MIVGLHANHCDSKTAHVADIIGPIFDILGKQLTGDYGGILEHLWIGLELVEYYSRPDGKNKFPFRFQKRVSGHSRYGLPPLPDKYNVGHFSVRPDYDLLNSLDTKQLIIYVLKLIYKELDILYKQEKRLGGFNAKLFKEHYIEECKRIGYRIDQ